MAQARSAFGVSASSGRRQRCGEAGSAASARLRRLALAGLAGLVFAGSVLSAAAADRTPKPVVAKAAAGTQCVEPPALMRAKHMEFLKHQRDQTVHGGIRGARHSLKGCIDCHASVGTGSVAQAPGDFCASCHAYAAVKIDCFDCHTPKSAKLALRPGGGR